MGWYEAIKDAIAAAEHIRDANLKQKLAAVQIECAKLAEENAKLRQDLLDLRQTIQTREEMQYLHDVYWRKSGDKLDGPYCPKCLDGEDKAVRMSDRSNDQYWRCSVCRFTIEKGNVHGRL